MADSQFQIPGEYSDPDRWRQIVLISAGGVRSWMSDRRDSAAALRPCVDVSMDARNPGLLRRIEDAVYDNPILLEEFATDIIIATERFTLIPSPLETDAAENEAIFTTAIGGDADMPMVSPLGSATILYSLEPGLEDFISRTFAGARTMHHLVPAALHFGRSPQGGTTLYADIRAGWIDMLAFRNKELIMACSQRWRDPADAAYYIFAACDAWELDPAADRFCLSGLKEPRTAVMTLLRRHINYVTLTLLPRDADRETLPLCVLLDKKRNSE